MQQKRLFARLDRPGERVLCGANSCGCPLALVVSEGDGRVVWFGKFWFYRKDGVWRMSKRQLTRNRGSVRVDVTPVGSDTRTVQVVISQLRPGSPGKGLMERLYPSGNMNGCVPVLPALAECPVCGRTQVLDAGPLRTAQCGVYHANRNYIHRRGTEEDLAHYYDLIRAWINQVPTELKRMFQKR